MLSLTFFSPYITFSPQPSLLTITPLKSPKDKHNSKTRNTGYHNDRSSFHCFSNKTQSSTSHCDNSSDIFGFQDNPDADSSDTGSVSQWVDSNELAVWLQRCNSVEQVKRIHAIALKCLSNSVTYVDNNLISVYVKFGKLIEARKVFDKMLERNVVSWTAMVNGYLKFGFDDEALRLFSESIRSVVRANGKMFVCVMSLCSRKLDLVLGRQIHACIVKGNWRNLIVDSAILHFYAQLGELSCAFRAFDGMSERDVVSWTTIITACSQQGQGDEAFLMFLRMLMDGFLPNEVHGIGKSPTAYKVLQQMPLRDVVSWTAMISGCSSLGHESEALEFLKDMLEEEGFEVDDYILTTVYNACGDIEWDMEPSSGCCLQSS
ncbi:hypothetical protein Patl1_08458 [Pistacia atlantica]|uniref:Uncharacterized protein n=1 Tax=Pistacia atlantica TaxID=434234 RepID=A0ACC1ADV0_9ROSI|nr:hypothetical protein Patl1_08458 [Pistacia atlantica]